MWPNIVLAFSWTQNERALKPNSQENHFSNAEEKLEGSHEIILLWMAAMCPALLVVARRNRPSVFCSDSLVVLYVVRCCLIPSMLLQTLILRVPVSLSGIDRSRIELLPNVCFDTGYTALSNFPGISFVDISLQRRIKLSS